MSSGRHDDVLVDRLVERIADGDRDALARLYDELAPLVYGIARRVLRDPSLADDVTQEVFVELWRKADRFDERRGRVATWVATIAHRRAVDRVRHEQRLRDLDARAGIHPPPWRPTAEDVAMDGARARDLRATLERLSPRQRQVLLLAYYDGLTQRESPTAWRSHWERPRPGCATVSSPCAA